MVEKFVERFLCGVEWSVFNFESTCAIFYHICMCSQLDTYTHMLAQIRTYIEMESHDENIAKMVKKSKEAEQREYAKRVAKVCVCVCVCVCVYGYLPRARVCLVPDEECR